MTILAIIGGVTVVLIGGGVVASKAIDRGWNPFR